MFFMVIFGMNVEEKYRWWIVVFVVCYYFYQVRDIFILHYSAQRNILLPPQQPSQTQPATTSSESTESFLESITPRYESSNDASQNRLYTVWVLFVHFVLSLHNGWIDPVLHRYRTMYREEERQAQQLIREAQELAEQARRQNEEQNNVVNAEGECDDMLLNLVADDVL